MAPSIVRPMGSLRRSVREWYTGQLYRFASVSRGSRCGFRFDGGGDEVSGSSLDKKDGIRAGTLGISMVTST